MRPDFTKMKPQRPTIVTTKPASLNLMSKKTSRRSSVASGVSDQTERTWKIKDSFVGSVRPDDYKNPDSPLSKRYVLRERLIYKFICETCHFR